MCVDGVFITGVDRRMRWVNADAAWECFTCSRTYTFLGDNHGARDFCPTHGARRLHVDFEPTFPTWSWCCAVRQRDGDVPQVIERCGLLPCPTLIDLTGGAAASSSAIVADTV